MNLCTEHTTYKRAGARNVLNRMCKSFEEMWPKSGLALAQVTGVKQVLRFSSWARTRTTDIYVNTFSKHFQYLIQ